MQRQPWKENRFVSVFITYLLAFLNNKYNLILETEIHTSEATFEGPRNCPLASYVAEKNKSLKKKFSSRLALLLTNSRSLRFAS